MSFLLDTCVISEFKKLSPDPNVLAWLASTPEESTFIAAVTFGELQKGISLLPRSKRRTSFERWFEQLVIRYDGRIIDMDLRVFTRWGTLKADCEKKGRTLPMIDSMIAATALEHGLTLITRNVSDFKNTGVTIRNIWESNT